MKLAFTTMVCPDFSLDEVIEAATVHNYAGVELRCDAGHVHSAEVTLLKAERQSIRSRFEAAQITPCFLATSLSFAKDDVLSRLEPRLELASDLNIAGLRVFVGRPNVDQYEDDSQASIAKRLAEAGRQAAAANVELWLETHDRVSLGADAAALIRQADHPSLGICYDNLHPKRMGETVEQTFAHIHHLVRHAHLHDGLADRDKVVITPLGQGQMTVDQALIKLDHLGFEGFVVGEWFYDQLGPDPNEALSLYHHDITELAEGLGIYFQKR